MLVFIDDLDLWPWSAFTLGLGFVTKCIKEDWEAWEAQAEGGPEYILALCDRGELYWWNALRRTQLAIPTFDKQQLPDSRRELLHSWLDLWVEFGALLGLNADNQRQLHESDQLQRCWRVGCDVRQSTSEENNKTIRLLKCAGCGDVRYCSKKCQRL